MNQIEYPDDPRLAEVARYLDRVRVSAWICDSELRLVWVSSEGLSNLRIDIGEELGIGRNMIENLISEPWLKTITPNSQVAVFAEAMPLLLANPDIARHVPELPDPWGPLMAQVVPAEQVPAMLATTFEYVTGDGDVFPVTWIICTLYESMGEFLGAFSVFLPSLRAGILETLSRGDEAMFERMARLEEPGRRSAAIMFIDVQDSGPLSRRLSSAAYFKLIRDLTSAVDMIIVKRLGIVGRHSGDGMTSFFLSEDTGGSSAAVRAAIEAARDVTVEARNLAKRVNEETGLIEPDDLVVNVGLHWGGTLYMGQLVTGGRLEITALGDEVNECARIQECARDGQVLASKYLLEHLDESEAASLGIQPDDALYRPLSEVPHATVKAKRDAGGIPVTIL